MRRILAIIFVLFPAISFAYIPYAEDIIPCAAKIAKCAEQSENYNVMSERHIDKEESSRLSKQTIISYSRSLFANGYDVCIPEETSDKDIIQAIYKWYLSNPDMHKKIYQDFLQKAVPEIYPCSNDSDKIDQTISSKKKNGLIQMITKIRKNHNICIPKNKSNDEIANDIIAELQKLNRMLRLEYNEIKNEMKYLYICKQ